MHHVAGIEQQQELPEIGDSAHQAIFFELLQEFLFSLVVGGGHDRSQLLLGFPGILQGAAVHRCNAAQLMQRAAFAGKCRKAVFGQNAPFLPNRFRRLLSAGAHADVESSLGRLHGALEQGFLADHVGGDFPERVGLLAQARDQLLGALVAFKRAGATMLQRLTSRVESTLAYLQHIGFC